MKANASRDANLGYGEVVREILKEADEIDRAEDERYGEAHRPGTPELRIRAELLRDGRPRLWE